MNIFQLSWVETFYLFNKKFYVLFISITRSFISEILASVYTDFVSHIFPWSTNCFFLQWTRLKFLSTIHKSSKFFYWTVQPANIHTRLEDLNLDWKQTFFSPRLQAKYHKKFMLLSVGQGYNKGAINILANWQITVTGSGRVFPVVIGRLGSWTACPVWVIFL